MKVLNVYVEGETKEGKKVSVKAYNFPADADIKYVLSTMKLNGLFNGWKSITAVYNLDNSRLIKIF